MRGSARPIKKPRRSGVGVGGDTAVVPARGFEPRFTASKADVLPLDEAGSSFTEIVDRVRRIRTST